MRTVTDLPVADHPFPLRVRISCYRGENSSYEREVLEAQHRPTRPSWFVQDPPITRHMVRCVTIERTSIAAIARELGLFLFRDTVDAITVEATTGRFTADPIRLESVRVIESTSIRGPYPAGVGDGYVTVVVDLTPVFDGTGPA